MGPGRKCGRGRQEDGASDGGDQPAAPRCPHGRATGPVDGTNPASPACSSRAMGALQSRELLPGLRRRGQRTVRLAGRTRPPDRLRVAGGSGGSLSWRRSLRQRDPESRRACLAIAGRILARIGGGPVGPAPPPPPPPPAPPPPDDAA